MENPLVKSPFLLSFKSMNKQERRKTENGKAIYPQGTDIVADNSARTYAVCQCSRINLNLPLSPCLP